MTWIKPSFLWMMYRSGWASKRGQDRVLAVEVTREGFEWALMNSATSGYESGVYASKEEWLKRKASAPVRVQWDPERSLTLRPLPYRTIQVGLSGEAARRYVEERIVSINEVTQKATEIRHLLLPATRKRRGPCCPVETPYPLSSALKKVVGAP